MQVTIPNRLALLCLDAIAKERVWAIGGDLWKIALFELVAFGPDSDDNERESQIGYDRQVPKFVARRIFVTRIVDQRLLG